MKRILLVCLITLLLPFVADAQTNVEKKESVRVYFRQGSAALEPGYLGNAAALDQLAELLKPYLSESSDTATGEGRVRIASSVSPEGSTGTNERLINARAKVISDWISKKFHVQIGYVIDSMGIDWQALEQLVAEADDLPYRDEVLEILRNTPEQIMVNGFKVNERQRQLERLRNGAPYRWIYTNLYPKLRYAAAYTEIWYATELNITSESPLNFAAEGGEGLITFKKDINDKVVPSVKATEDWISGLKPTSDDATFTVAPNTVAAPRQAVVTLESYGKQYDVTVNQEAAEPIFTISESETNRAVGANAGEDTIPYQSNGTASDVPVATSDADWISDITPTEEGITYKYAANPSSEPRTATITAQSLGKTNTVTVNQAGAEPTSEGTGEPTCKPFYMSVQTNMLYDLGLVPNIGVEFYLGENFSIDASWQYSWWKSDKKAWYWRTYGGDVALRYWLGKKSRIKPLTGHHLGLYGQMITYDFEVGNKGLLADRWSWAAGIEYGYSLPIGRRLNLDFTAGVGYHWGEFYEYLPIDGHYVWQATKRRQYIGPTKLEISLVWLIGCGNYNKEKGGKR